MPVLFIAWGLLTLVQRAQTTPGLALVWLVAAAAGAALAWALPAFEAPMPDRATGLVRVRGTAFPLVRNLVLFAAKYALTAAMAVTHGPAATLALADTAVSGLSAGYFLGWIALLALAYRDRPPLTAPPALP